MCTTKHNKFVHKLLYRQLLQPGAKCKFKTLVNNLYGLTTLPVSVYKSEIQWRLRESLSCYSVQSSQSQCKQYRVSKLKAGVTEHQSDCLEFAHVSAKHCFHVILHGELETVT